MIQRIADIQPVFALLFSFVVWAGIGLSYHSVYLAHLLLPIAWISIFVQCNRERMSLSPKNYLLQFWALSLGIFALHLTHVTFFPEALRHLIILSIGASVSLYFSLHSFSLDAKSPVIRGIQYAAGFEIIIALLETTGLFRWPVSSISSMNVLLGYPDLMERFDNDQQALDYLLTSPTGFHWNPNDLALSLLLILPWLLLNREYSSTMKRALQWVIPVALLFIFVQAGARLVFLAALLFFIVAFFLPQFNRRIAGFSIIVSLFFATNIFFIGPSSFTKMDEMKVSYFTPLGFDFGVKKEDNSGGTRIALFFRTLDMVKSAKALGVGGGQAQAIIHSEGGLGKHHDSSVHNYWLEYLAEGGIFAESLFIAFYWILLVGTWLDYRRHGKAMALVLFITLLLFFVGSISLSSCIYFLPMYLLFGIASGYLISRPYALHLSLKYPFIVANEAEHIARS
jgi:hypothetical protein